MTTTPLSPEKIVYHGRIVCVKQQEFRAGDTVKVFERAERAPGVRMIITDGQRILLTHEYRHELERYDYRLPGGKVVDSLEEYLEISGDMTAYAEEAVRREAREEAGVDVQSLRLLGVSHCGATMVWDLYYYVVEQFQQLPHQQLEAGESITVQWFSIDEVYAMCMNGAVSEERSALVLLRFIPTLSSHEPLD
ncbi:NUDIX hydrolase [Candidatus Peribacteria bacterium]|nr:NUDIX hydrolase [Candidatus Peribacteria bacterium]